MEQTEDQFYISLMSNSSLDEYPDNTLSAFTNKLARPCRVNENWVVGVTEIFFNSFSSSAKLQMLPVTNEDVDTFPPVTVTQIKPTKTSKKRKNRERIVRHNYQHLELQPITKKNRRNTLQPLTP